MNKKVILILCSALTLVSCELKPVDSSQESVSQEESSSKVKVYSNEDYYWYFNEGDYLSSTLNFGVSSFEESAFKVKIDDEIVNPDTKTKWDFKLFYKTEDCNADNANNASDYLYANGTKLGKVASNVGDEGYPISFDNINIGDNIFRFTTGGFWGAAEFSEKNALTGAFDDYYIYDIYLQASTGEIFKPTKLVFYKAKKGLALYSKTNVTYKDGVKYKIGDGWSGNIAYDGNPTEGYDIPSCIEVYFEYVLPESMKTYTVDTTKYSDGDHYVTLTDSSNNILCQNNVVIDNNAPTVNASIEDDDNLSRSYKFGVTLTENISGITSQSIKVDGKEIENGIVDTSTLSIGNHNLVVYGKDGAGNEIYDYRNFYVSDCANNLIENSSGTLLDTSSTNENEFVINVTDDSKDVCVSYNGTNQENELIALKAYNNTTLEYDTLATCLSSEAINFKFNPSNYVKNNKVTIKAELVYSQDGNANMIYWSSDTQYLPKADFTDINGYYSQIMNYVVNKYNDNTISYYMHTGDIVDDNPTYEESVVRGEWDNATVAFKILDDANIPYGTCAGNHDVGTDINSLNYCYYDEYFGNERFNTKSCYGGALNDNECHYDLISIGDYDFVIVYIGFGIEARDETVEWANKVLQKYSHRNAIIATHGYLDGAGARDSAIQAEDIYERIVCPNENVKFVCSGHTDGSFCNKETTPSGRVFYEILNCYQFYESQKYSISHKINGYNCNGEGFMKSLQFNKDGTVTVQTFSPILNVVKDPYGGIATLNITVDLVKANRVINTNLFVAYQ